MDDGSRYSGYDGCIVGGTRPTDINVTAGTQSTIDRGAIRSIVDMPGTQATTVDCGGTCSHDWIMWLVHKATKRYEGGTIVRMDCTDGT